MRRTTYFKSAVLCSLIAIGGLGGCGGSSDTTSSNPVPKAQADTYDSLAWNRSETLDVLANDMTPSGTTLNLVSVTTPAHGTAKIVNNKVVYTPTANYFGPDSFSYAVNGVADGTTATATVSLTVNASLTFAGKATDEPLANAKVTVKVGENTYTTTTNALGEFSIPIVTNSPDNFISVTAQGTGAQSHVKLVSLVGDSQTAAAVAGTDGKLVADELPGINVTNVTTALYVQVIKQNSGSVPTTQSSLEAAASRVSGDELMQMAAMIKLVADTGTGITLPSGASDTLALVSTSETYNQFAQNIVQNAPEKLANTITAIQADPNLSSTPSTIVTTTKSLLYYSGKGCCAKDVLGLELNPDGTASVSEGGSILQATWAKADNAIVVTYANPRITNYFSSDQNQLAVRDTITSFQIRQFTGTQNSGVSTFTFKGTTSYPNGEKSTEPLSYSMTYAFGEISRFNAPSASELSGNTFVGLTNLIANSFGATDQYSLAFASDGTAQSPEMPGIAITWKIEEGKLVISYSNGMKQVISRLSVAPDGEEHWLISVSNASGNYALGEAMVVKAQAGAKFVNSMAANRWLSSVNAGYVQNDKFYLNLLSNQSGQEELVSLDGTTDADTRIGWQVESGKLVMNSYLLPDYSIVGSCSTGQTCQLYKKRTWTLLRESGTTIFVLEHLKTRSGYNQYRVNRYDKSTK